MKVLEKYVKIKFFKTLVINQSLTITLGSQI